MDDNVTAIINLLAVFTIFIWVTGEGLRLRRELAMETFTDKYPKISRFIAKYIYWVGLVGAIIIAIVLIAFACIPVYEYAKDVF